MRKAEGRILWVVFIAWSLEIEYHKQKKLRLRKISYIPLWHFEASTYKFFKSQKLSVTATAAQQ